MADLSVVEPVVKKSINCYIPLNPQQEPETPTLHILPAMAEAFYSNRVAQILPWLDADGDEGTTAK